MDELMIMVTSNMDDVDSQPSKFGLGERDSRSGERTGFATDGAEINDDIIELIVPSSSPIQVKVTYALFSMACSH